MNKKIPVLVTSGEIARELGVKAHKVVWILQSRPHIRPAAMAGGAFIYRLSAIKQVELELRGIEEAKSGRK